MAVVRLYEGMDIMVAEDTCFCTRTVVLEEVIHMKTCEPEYDNN